MTLPRQGIFQQNRGAIPKKNSQALVQKIINEVKNWLRRIHIPRSKEAK